MATIKSRCAILSNTPRAPIEIRSFEIEAPPEHSIAVKVVLAGICGTDPHLWKGDIPLPAPIVLGHEGIGEVVDVHPSVTTDHADQPLSRGDLVYWTAIRPCGQCYQCTVANDQCGCPHNGFMHTDIELSQSRIGTWATYSQHVTLGPRNAFYRTSPNIPPEAYIALGCALPTVIQAISRLRDGAIKPFENVVVQGCGAVGLAAIMMARISGATKIVAVDRNSARLAKAKEFGVDETLNMEEHREAGARADIISKIMGSRGATLAFECSGDANAVRDGLNLLSRNGIYVLIGTWAGKDVVPFNPFEAVHKALTIYGSTYCAPRDYYKATKIVEQNWVRFPLASCVTHRFHLDETQQGLETAMNGEAIKGVIVPN